MDNSSYMGEFIHNRFHGKGKYTFANGGIYDGDWVDGKRNG